MHFVHLLHTCVNRKPLILQAHMCVNRKTLISYVLHKRSWQSHPLVLFHCGNNTLSEEEAIVIIKCQVLLCVLLRLVRKKLQHSIGQYCPQFPEKK